MICESVSNLCSIGLRIGNILIFAIDFDQTLANTHGAVSKSLLKVCEEFHINIDEDRVGHLAKSGKSLASLLELINVEQVRGTESFKHHYLHSGLQHTTLMSGATELLDAVSKLGAELVLISAKTQANLNHSMRFLNLERIRAFGDLYGEGKTKKLRELKAVIYVGDQESDILSANQANVISVLISAEDLKNPIKARPNFTFPNLLEFCNQLPTILK